MGQITFDPDDYTLRGHVSADSEKIRLIPSFVIARPV
jgi:hypothetical protein